MSIADRVRLQKVETLFKGNGVLQKATFDLRRRDGSWQTQSRETYGRGNAATILLYDEARQTVILTKQFRYPAFADGFDDLLIETPAGMLEDADPETRIRKEVEEETGFRVGDVRQIFAAYSSPGAFMEKLFYFVAPYSPSDRVSEGGGKPGEGEDIEILEIGIDAALGLIETGEIRDAKTIILLQYAALHLFSERA